MKMGPAETLRFNLDGRRRDVRLILVTDLPKRFARKERDRRGGEPGRSSHLAGFKGNESITSGRMLQRLPFCMDSIAPDSDND